MSFYVLLRLLKRRREQYKSKRSDGRPPVSRRDARDLLDEGGEEEEYVGVF